MRHVWGMRQKNHYFQSNSENILLCYGWSTIDLALEASMRLS